ncbi:MAG: GTP-binding protein [Candidatus Cryptobacteroides sp.]|nr:GTP-binding protein [Bacteroides sp.]MDY5303046.1 GTP-binding protein [Candidatus Cryptobacteroides sp.]MCI7196115.1 GTP-binding protein [Bacteroides sp.]MCI7547665.1 GTP-binding protein [Bacteroides sp.]MCI7663699.1 GTP-binding protein [Bacteroides sp.]
METQNTKGYLNMQLLRFTTAGSVDDGKSTLIGRLLYDSKSIFEDQLEAVEEASRSRGNEEVNLALLTDGLRAEREQGITIDVAYRYFATPKRKFIIADTPGHIQYTRNMVTGASTADLAVILVDARHGIMEQTVRHSYIASLLAIKEVVVCVNKMDLVDFSQEVFDKIVADYKEMSSSIEIGNVTFIPISAKLGDNVVNKSENMPWYTGKALLDFLETVQLPVESEDSMRLPVQYVVRPISDKFPDFRGYAGRLAEGSIKKGDKIKVYPSEMTSSVTGVYLGEKELETAVSPESVDITLSDDIDISRGDVIVAVDGKQPHMEQDVLLNVCWFRNSPMQQGKKYVIRHATQQTLGIIKEIEYKIDINTREKEYGVDKLIMNDIARVRIKTADPLIFDYYKDNRTMGSLIFIEEGTNDTVGAGMIVPDEA